MAWVRYRYRGCKVWILVDPAGAPTLDARGLASLRYRPEDERTYSVRPGEIHAVDERPPEAIGAWIHVEPKGGRVGAVLSWRGRRREIVGRVPAPSQRAAAAAAAAFVLEQVRRGDLPVRLHVPEAPVLARIVAARGAGPRAPAAQALRRAARRFADLDLLAPDDSEEARRASALAAGTAAPAD